MTGPLLTKEAEDLAAEVQRLKADASERERYIGQLEARLASEDPRRMTIFRNSNHHIRAEAAEIEREACAKLVESFTITLTPPLGEPKTYALAGIAQEIRARGGP